MSNEKERAASRHNPRNHTTISKGKNLSFSKNSNRNSKVRKKEEGIDITTVKEKKTLEEDYSVLKQCIINGSLEKFKNILSNQDNKWYLENNDLDYELFIQAIIYSRSEFIRAMENLKYILNPNTLLIEVFEIYMIKRYKENISSKEKRRLLNSDNIKYLVTNNYGINPQTCILEFYFLLMAFEYEAAVKLLSMPYANLLRDKLNETFIGDENHFLQQILNNQDIIKDVICISLERHLDGVAYEIYSFTDLFLDEKILRCAVVGDCSFFLEEVWENSRKFGDVKNYSAPKISFSKYISCMLEEGKFEMASYAIKNWRGAYKEENIFEILVDKNEELAM